MYGLGGGFAISNPNATLHTKYKDLISLIACDKYTGILKYLTKIPDREDVGWSSPCIFLFSSSCGAKKLRQ